MSEEPRSVVARAVFPTEDVADVLPLYVDGDAGALRSTTRHGAVVAAGGRISLGSYFNAFPAAYWSAETDLDAVEVRVRTRGRGVVDLLRSDAVARPALVDRRDVAGEASTSLTLRLADVAQGGAAWLDLAAADEDLELLGAEWTIARRSVATVTAVMATFDRNADCLRQLGALSAARELDGMLDRVVVVDQGSAALADAPGFDAVARALGERLVLVRQENLGGSGGFSRGMLEALRRGESDHVLLLDDDAITEPEAVFRAVRFAEAAREPVLVGGGMLHIDDRAVLYTQSEQWDARIGWVDLSRPGAYDHDFRATGFREAPFFHTAQRSDFNGWWMCLIPADVLRRIGLSLPLFLKGDDVEFGLRARAHGVRTVSPTGIALWHLGWGGKAPTRSWEAYFLHRNRLITELLHAPRRRPSGVILHSFLGDMKPLVTLQYSGVRLRAQAIADVLAGPGRLPGWLATRVLEVRRLWRGFADAVPLVDAPALPPAGPKPRGRAAQASTLLRAVLRQALRPVPRDVRPSVHIRAAELGWWSFAARDAAVVDTADGTARVLYRRDRAATVRAFWRSVRLHLRLWLAWPALSRRFRDAAPALASPEAWSEATRS